MSFSSDFDSDDFYNGHNMDHLSCIRNAHLMPESSSLHSLDMLPVEIGMAPGLMAVTLKTVDSQHLYNSSGLSSGSRTSNEASGGGFPIWSMEVRVVHGTDETHSIIRKSVLKAQPDKPQPAESLTKGVWAIVLKSVIDTDQDFLVKFSCDLLESLIRNGWEVCTNGRTTTTPGFEYVTWIFKAASTAAPANVEVVSLVMSEDNGTFRVVPSAPQINNIVKKAISTFSDKTKAEAVADKTKNGVDNSKLDGVENLIKEIERKVSRPDGNAAVAAQLAAAGAVGNIRKPSGIGSAIIPKDDPDCPNIFKVDKLKKKTDPAGKEDRIICSNILLETVHLLFCRQWRIITATRLPMRDNKMKSVVEADIVFFCRDGRILPSLGQQKFTMIELEGPNYVRLYNMPDKVVSSLREVLLSENHWPEGLASKDPIARTANCREFRCRGSPWTHKRRPGARAEQAELEDKLVARSTVFANHLVSQLLLAMNRNDFNLFSVVQLGPAGASKKNHLIFKHSSVKFADSVCIHLSGQNKLVVIGGGEAEVSAVRHTLTSRWPYPVSIDKPMGPSKLMPNMWLFKVKRYPWAVSYGNKYLDRTIEWTRSLLRSRQVAIPSPQNSDSESGKSVLVFLLKELMSLGWRVQSSADISSSIYSSNSSGGGTSSGGRNRQVQPRLSDPHSIFLMK